MDVDEKTNIYNNGVMAGQKHQVSSPETIKLFKEMGDEIKKIEITLEGHSKDISYIKEGINDIRDNNKSVSEFIRCANDNFASKKEFNKFKENADNQYADKKTVDKVFWIMLTTLLGILVWTLKTFVYYLATK